MKKFWFLTLPGALFLWLYAFDEAPPPPARRPASAAPTARAPEPPPANSANPAAHPRAELAARAERLEQTKECYHRECDFPQTDPKSYELAVGQELKTQLTSLHEWARANEVRDPRLTALAVAYLASEDGHVQAAALALLAEQAPSREALDAILEHVVGGYDAELIQAALRELARYQDEDSRSRIATALADAIVTGSPFVAKEISGGLEPFLFARSVPLFAEAAARLPGGSAIRANVERALASFRG